MTSTTEANAGDRKKTEGFKDFIELFKAWLSTFEVNNQLFVEIMKDEELPLPARAIAAGVLIYIVTVKEIIPDIIKRFKILGLIDDVIVMIAGLSIIVPMMPTSRLEYYRQKYEAVVRIKEYEDILQSILGILWERLRQFAENLGHRSYKKATAEEIILSPVLREDLFDETMIYVANLNLDPTELDKQLKALPPPERVLGLLASGLEEEQKREDKDTTESKPRRLIGWALPTSKENTEQ